MTNHEFMCWLEGFVTLSDDMIVDRKQYAIIRHHAELVEAVSGRLEPTVRELMSQLDTAFKQADSITMLTFKQFLL